MNLQPIRLAGVEDKRPLVIAGPCSAETEEQVMARLGAEAAKAEGIEVTDEDIEYLRKIAEMEWRNEFTTAEIKIDMTNNNTVNGERDLDGIVSYLSDVLREEMTNVAYGVHY